MVVNIDVEYCGTCGYATKFEEMKQIFQKQSDVNLTGHEGRRASFEVKVNDTLIHSKLSTMAFPDFEDVSKIAAEVAAGHDVPTKCKQQPITNCVVM